MSVTEIRLLWLHLQTCGRQKNLVQANQPQTFIYPIK